MTIVTNEHELAADTHVDTAEKHDSPGDNTPEQQEVQSPERIGLSLICTLSPYCVCTFVVGSPGPHWNCRVHCNNNQI